MTWLIGSIVVLLLACGWAVCESFYHLGDLHSRLSDRVANLEAGRGTLAALCCDLERQVHVLSHRLDLLQMEIDDEPFTPDTDLEDE